MVSYRIVSVQHVNTQYRIESLLPGIAHLQNTTIQTASCSTMVHVWFTLPQNFWFRQLSFFIQLYNDQGSCTVVQRFAQRTQHLQFSDVCRQFFGQNESYIVIALTLYQPYNIKVPLGHLRGHQPHQSAAMGKCKQINNSNIRYRSDIID